MMGGSVALGIRFNPTLVRLRPDVEGGIPLPRGEFQSHAGSIEAFPPRDRRFRYPPFQSHAGSIEVCVFLRRILPRIRFQSHAGSIEAHRASSTMSAMTKVSIPRWFD